MAIGRYLADKSAFEQQRHSEAADGLLKALAADGALLMTEIVALELLYSARNRAGYDTRWDGLMTLPWLHTSRQQCPRAHRRSNASSPAAVSIGVPSLIFSSLGQRSSTKPPCSTTTGTST